MVAAVRLFIEGGGRDKEPRAFLRQGFHAFFGELIAVARSQRISWNLTVCGSRENAYRLFTNALDQYSDAFVILLVDAEGPVRDNPWDHLRVEDGWRKGQATDDQAHLMVQVMEAWLVADQDALAAFYGQGFLVNRLPAATGNVETFDRHDLARALADATRQTSKGKYHKIQHAYKLLGIVSPSKVRTRAPSCDRLFSTVAGRMQAVT